MKKVYMFLAEGFEETEAITPLDILLRAGADVETVSVSGNRYVTGSHGITVEADTVFERMSDFDMLILPGGGKGTQNLAESAKLGEILKAAFADGKYIAAICAAPTVLAKYGILEGRKAVCYPGMESGLTGAKVTREPVVTDGNVTTAAGMGVSVQFGLRLAEILYGSNAASQLAQKIVY